MFNFLFDNSWTRQRRAKEIQRLFEKFKIDPESKTLKEIEQFAKNNNRFTRCYALNTLGRLGNGSRSAIATVIEALESGDPFVRHAAAEAIFNIARQGDADTLGAITEYIGKLVAPSKDYKDESAGAFATRTLDVLKKRNS